MPEKKTDNVLAKWLSGDLTPEERNQLESEKGMTELKIVLEEMDSWELKKPTRTAQNIIEGTEKKTKGVQITSWKPYLQVAAAVILIATSWFVFQTFGSETKIQTQAGETKDITLPDGSVASMDASSTLTFSEDTWSTDRQIEMTGQVFFDVKSGSTFQVTSLNGTVEVLGTEFSILSIDSMFQVECFEGKVQVSSQNNSSTLIAGFGAKLENDILAEYEHNLDSPNWKKGFSRFDKTELKEVYNELKRRYSLNGELPEKYHDLRFSGTFSHNDLQAACLSVFAPMGVKYDLKESTIFFY